jgi:hypothetical protein
MIAEVVHENLREFAGGIQQAYAQYHHARHHGGGVFWQGRFKSKPVEMRTRNSCVMSKASGPSDQRTSRQR